VVEHLHSNHEALSSTSQYHHAHKHTHTTKKKKKREKETKRKKKAKNPQTTIGNFAAEPGLKARGRNNIC
jgi:hypothetical protein